MFKYLLNRRGFALLELIVVMSVVAILAVIGIPKFMDYTKDARFTRLASDARLVGESCYLYYEDYGVWPVESESVPMAGTLRNSARNVFDADDLVGHGSFHRVILPLLKDYVRLRVVEEDYYMLLSNVGEPVGSEVPPGDEPEPGDGVPADPVPDDEGPFVADPADLRDVVRVLGVHGSSLAILSDGSVYLWGKNDDGQLGDGKTDNVYLPFISKRLKEIDIMSAGYDHRLILRRDGSVYTWLGYGPFNLNCVEDFTKGCAVRCLSGDSFLAWRNNWGEIWGWGNIPWCGVSGDLPQQILYSNFGEPTFSGSVNLIGGGNDRSVFMCDDGSVWEWRVGDDDPVKVNGLPYITNVSVGDDHCLAIDKLGLVWSWGSNDYGKLGDGTAVDRDIPVQVAGLPRVRTVFAGWHNSLAVDHDGNLWAWGKNNCGQLGNGRLEDSYVPVQVKGPDGVGYLTGVRMVNGGWDHHLALCDDGTVWAWGSNEYGELGIGRKANYYDGKEDNPLERYPVHVSILPHKGARSERELGAIPIYTAEELAKICDDSHGSTHPADGIYIQMADIDLAGIDWVPIGCYNGPPFSGTFDGNGFVISNLTINQSDAGLFYQTLEGSKLTNINLKDVNINGSGVAPLVSICCGSVENCKATGYVEGDSCVSGLVSMLYGEEAGYEGAHIKSSSSECTVVCTGSYYAAGLVAHISSVETGIRNSIIDCCFTGSVTAANADYVGGLVGQSDGLIKSSYACCDVTGNGSVGNLVGFQTSGSSIVLCYSTGSVTGNRGSTGGLVGLNTSGTIKSSHSESLVYNGYESGGLVGFNTGSIEYCHATGAVNGKGIAGGLVGRSSGSDTVQFSYFSGSVKGSDSVGGLIGENWSTVKHCYCTGFVENTSASEGSITGGLFGSAGGNVSYCYAASAMEYLSDVKVGGLCGDYCGANFKHCYWDMDKSGQQLSVGGDGSGGNYGGKGLTTAQMRQRGSYSGWNFINTWGIDVGQSYPYLKCLEQLPHPQ